jgi:hypothetical protein
MPPWAQLHVLGVGPSLLSLLACSLCPECRLFYNKLTGTWGYWCSTAKCNSKRENYSDMLKIHDGETLRLMMESY